ncbi:DUF3987 domain-containing protein [Streptomyces sp. RKAG337]|uniref:DUF3987 domain-containing protein n=1 Tax=Streptomyces sp. RKAG337 TaxID=2893404 RepID=UPI00203438AF|nr:DUF3987 domain-containing protein [Streptomyces sp. RKAG337]MCM2429344.1 DUF3987 domain-containing protein [Streptomyces sp. RKAG337]
MNAPVLYGPIGRTVRAVAPHIECDPVGVYVAALSMWSAAIGQSVRVSSRGNARPALLWSALVAGTGRGKGTALRAAQHVMRPAVGRFLDTHTTSGITSGASLVNYLWEQQEATEETEAGRDVRALVIEEEWSEVLRRVKRDPSFTAKLRAAWDGAPLRNTTKDDPQAVDDPSLVLHTHITPSDWTRYIGAQEASGGSYNRIMPFTLRAVPMLDDDRATLPPVDGGDLSDAYAWATIRPRVISLTDDARPLWQIIRRYSRITAESLPEAQAVFIERTAEQALRVAACLAASECSDTIDHACLSAAFSLVRYSVQCAVNITDTSEAPKATRKPATLADKVRARIALHGGRATSSQVLPYVGATAAEVKALPGIVVTQERSAVGRPATVFTIATDSSDYAPLGRPGAQRQSTSPTVDANRSTVVRLDTYRPTTPETPRPVATVQRPQRSAPVQVSEAVSSNPFRALL